MKRREFITLLGGAAAWPLAARAQQAGGKRRIGVLMNIMSDDPESQIRLAAFAQGLQQLGWIVGQNVIVDTRWGAGNLENLRKYSAELVALGPDVIMANSSAAVSHILDATHAIPVVFTTVTDPVGAGYVESLAHPGGNITGFTNFEYAIAGKWLELLKEIAPRISRVAVMRESAVAAGPGQFAAIQAAAAPLGIDLRPVDPRDPSEIEHAICGVCARAKWRPDRDWKLSCVKSSKADLCACGSAPIACRLQCAFLCQRWRPDLLRA